MRRSFARFLLLAAAATALFAAIPVAQAGTARNHVVNTTIKGATVETRGPVSVDAILVKDKSLGEGAGLLFIKSAGGDKLSFTFKIWYDAGVQKGAGLVTFVPQPDGSATFSGTAHYTGGTRKFKGITGQLQVVNGVATADSRETVQVKGTAKY